MYSSLSKLYRKGNIIYIPHISDINNINQGTVAQEIHNNQFGEVSIALRGHCLSLNKATSKFLAIRYYDQNNEIKSSLLDSSEQIMFVMEQKTIIDVFDKFNNICRLRRMLTFLDTRNAYMNFIELGKNIEDFLTSSFQSISNIYWNQGAYTVLQDISELLRSISAISELKHNSNFLILLKNYNLYLYKTIDFNYQCRMIAIGNYTSNFRNTLISMMQTGTQPQDYISQLPKIKSMLENTILDDGIDDKFLNFYKRTVHVAQEGLTNMLHKPRYNLLKTIMISCRNEAKDIGEAIRAKSEKEISNIYEKLKQIPLIFITP